MTKKITVFTPTYNRAFCLTNCYDSLVRQTNKDFKWLIIDDGSQDDTKALVNSWIEENKIDIQYHYQENQGMHSGHNAAYQIIDTELNVCIDSDDFMPDDAVEKILAIWDKQDDKKNIAGIIGLDAFTDGSVAGKIPDNLKYSTLKELELDYKIKGDKKIVLRTDVVKEYPLYPITKIERLVPLGTLYLMIGQKYKFICSNEVFCIIEYLEDGSSNTILSQYKKSPNGFRYARTLEMKYSDNLKYTFTRAIHYISSCIFTKKWFFTSENPKRIVTLLAFPFGILFHCYILFKIRK